MSHTRVCVCVCVCKVCARLPGGPRVFSCPDLSDEKRRITWGDRQVSITLPQLTIPPHPSPLRAGTRSGTAGGRPSGEPMTSRGHTFTAWILLLYPVTVSYCCILLLYTTAVCYTYDITGSHIHCMDPTAVYYCTLLLYPTAVSYCILLLYPTAVSYCCILHLRRHGVTH